MLPYKGLVNAIKRGEGKDYIAKIVDVAHSKWVLYALAQSASYLGNGEMLELLLDKMGSLDEREQLYLFHQVNHFAGKKFRSPASTYQRCEVLRLLIRRFPQLNLDQVPDNMREWRTLLHLFAAGGQTEEVEILLEAGANPCVKSSLGTSKSYLQYPVVAAIQNEHLETAKVLLEAQRKRKQQEEASAEIQPKRKKQKT